MVYPQHQVFFYRLYYHLSVYFTSLCNPFTCEHGMLDSIIKLIATDFYRNGYLKVYATIYMENL